MSMHIDDHAIANKYARVISYFKFSHKMGKMETIFREMETSSKNVVDINAAGFLLLLLKYFSEEEDQRMDQTTRPSEVDCAELPCTPCIILCDEVFLFLVLLYYYHCRLHSSHFVTHDTSY